ncbi:alcohol dehydrogenase [Nocardioides marmoriginsengisoli]|uniref:Alcohol dehydrogenase n=1 Tax=Nocardioides marmoriginsengisoli TaxID=661483 RepID=A0A3N0CG68_9ACTN|nr:alcohol dehydrogenase catalytic domain-containing protein [Nocardioides marmoriginsengisoli]RNL62454.1 alcohol dehydrogenase [Nocardioides marmoriginsengisoli]
MSPSEQVRAAVLTGPGAIELQTFPRPPTDADSALLLVEANGICGTDVHFRGDGADVPRILGHEVVGRILEIGDLARERWGVEAGDRVAVEAGIACGTCRSCLDGFAQTCAARLGYGSNVTTDVAPALWGGLSELMHLAPGSVLTKVDDAVGADVAAGWFSPLANAVDWTGETGGSVQPGQTVLVLGPGPQGLAICLAAKARGAGQVILVGLARDRHRLDAGTSLGADVVVEADVESVLEVVAARTNGAMADVVLDVSGNRESARTAALAVRPRGTIVAASPINTTDDVGLPLRDLIWKQVRWQGVLSNRPSAAPAAAVLLAAHAEQLAPLVTHRFDLAAADQAIDVVAGVDPAAAAIKVVVCPNGVPSS